MTGRHERPLPSAGEPMRKPSVVQWRLSTRLLKARNALHTGNSIGEAMGILMPFVSSHLHGKRSQRLILTGLTRCRAQTLFSLRQHGTFHFSCVSVFALVERKNRNTKEAKYRSAEGWIADCVS